MGMSVFAIISVLLYLFFIVAAVYFIFKWVNKFIALKEEQNDLLREVVKKMGNKEEQKNV